ncbi:MAG: RNA polymerase sigma factor [Candidatus Limnocylindrales bacterium]
MAIHGRGPGASEAFAILVGQTSDRMYAIATRILRDTDLAQDALQSAMLTAWRSLPSLRDPGTDSRPGSASSSSMPATPRPTGCSGRTAPADPLGRATRSATSSANVRARSSKRAESNRPPARSS